MEEASKPDHDSLRREGLREQIARIVDPYAWEKRAHFVYWIDQFTADTEDHPEEIKKFNNYAEEAVAGCLMKADAIIAALEKR
jgi:hypothetical protein